MKMLFDCAGRRHASPLSLRITLSLLGHAAWQGAGGFDMCIEAHDVWSGNFGAKGGLGNLPSDMWLSSIIGRLALGAHDHQLQDLHHAKLEELASSVRRVHACLCVADGPW